jgi:uncharacterized protein (DUF885 family)
VIVAVRDVDEEALNAGLRVADDAWDELRRTLYVQRRMGIIPARLPDLSLPEAQRRSEVGKSLLQRIESIEEGALPHDLALTLRLVSFRARTWSREADWYWLVTDPIGTGYFGLFLPTAYCGARLLSAVQGQLAAFQFVEIGDADRYLALVADYARLVQQFAIRTGGQAERGIRMPKLQVLQARALLTEFKSQARMALSVTPKRLANVAAKGFREELENRIRTSVETAFDHVLAEISEDYLNLAPDAVGIGQYPHGAELYRELVKLHTTLEMTPEEIRDRGLARLAEIRQSMADIRAELEFDGDGTEFLSHLNGDSRWRAGTDDALTAIFHRYLDRLRPHLRRYFSTAPRAACGVAPLPKSLQGAMTFGYYDSPQRERSEGRYMFNSANLAKQAIPYLGSLTYHELMPGHHLHTATQLENESLHPFRKYSLVNAYSEAWAEYAALFAGEIGLYEQPEERYGRMMFEEFLTSRLVVDTGMNAFGWSLERARDFMRKHSGLAESEILTEALRYSSDLPGQALAYKLGDLYMLSLRERMRSSLGAQFKLKDFHAAVLSAGSLPLADLAWHLDRETMRLRS